MKENRPSHIFYTAAITFLTAAKVVIVLLKRKFENILGINFINK